MFVGTLISGKVLFRETKCCSLYKTTLPNLFSGMVVRKIPQSYNARDSKTPKTCCGVVFSWNGMGDLYQVKGMITGLVYRQILIHHLVSFACRLLKIFEKLVSKWCDLIGWEIHVTAVQPTLTLKLFTAKLVVANFSYIKISVKPRHTIHSRN